MHALDYMLFCLLAGTLAIGSVSAINTPAPREPQGLGEFSTTEGVGFSDGWDSTTANAVAAAQEGR